MNESETEPQVWFCGDCRWYIPSSEGYQALCRNYDVMVIEGVGSVEPVPIRLARSGGHACDLHGRYWEAVPVQQPGNGGPMTATEVVQQRREDYFKGTRKARETDTPNAPDLLQQAAHTIRARGEQRDRPDGERSMAKTVAMFNALKGTELSEIDGWDFMICLKMARAEGGAYQADDYLDRIGYSALAAEAAAKEQDDE